MSGKRKYSVELKIKIVQEYLSGKSGGMHLVAEKYNMSYGQLKRWIHLYEQHGAEGLRQSSRTFSGEFKIHVVEYMHENRMSLSEAAYYFCIQNISTISKWERIYYEEGRDALLIERRGRSSMKKKNSLKTIKSVDNNEDLLAEVQRLRMENEYLKKLNALVQEREKSKQRKK